MTLNDNMAKMTERYDAKDYTALEEQAHGLKGASAYIGASRLHYACYFVQQHYEYERFEKQLECYPALIEAAIEFKTHSRKIIAEDKGKSKFRRKTELF